MSEKHEALEPVEIGFGYVFVSKYKDIFSTHVVTDVKSGNNFDSMEIVNDELGQNGTSKREYIHHLTGQILSKGEILDGIKKYLGRDLPDDLVTKIDRASQKPPRIITG